MIPLAPSEIDAWRRAYDDARTRMTSALALLVPTGGALTASFLFTPDDVESGRVVLSAPCMTRMLFGFGCPTCGMTRAFMALSHRDLWRALDYNVLSPAAYLVVWALLCFALVRLFRANVDWLRARRRLSP